ncbi:DNA polymerase III subunit alpha [Buchnera aphidicola]|uniref:DNA polymerase III subunit alpha n=1 Tax=Buchnera aphidicola subsp. Cinara cedri (strain Cc) TaxID=372461 RepID=Q057S5_BUCCC|nr:DNA polymerase III subunit alpha [Buchnera aphidicola]ABJ90624.1 DNA polymerase III, a subunit [Buchnera aphidicola BCc]
MYITDFVHIRIHSDYSMIDGIIKPKKLVEYAKLMNMKVLGITDISNLHGVIKFYSSACKLGIKPIIGVDIIVSSKFEQNVFSNLTLLARNNIGYNNIIKLLSESYQSGYDNNIGLVIKIDDLLKYRKGLLVLSGGIKGNIGKCIFNNKKKLLYKYLLFYKKYFLNKFYLEISRLGYEKEEEYIIYIKYISYKFSLPIVATNEVLFLKKKDFQVHKIKVAIYKKKTISDSNFVYKYTENQFLRKNDEMIKIFHDCPEAIINSFEISKRCNVIIPSGSYFLPLFPTGSINLYDFFVKKSKEGLKKRLKTIYLNKNKREKKKDIYFSRLEYELLIIKKMGFISYFLIVMEFIQWAKKNNIPVGPGRGSGSGSLVSFALNITEIDPLKFNLLFERFLNPNRISLPDFDIDFCMNKRDLVIDHVSKKYGRNSVAQIITFGTMAAKAVVRDVGRVLGYPYGLINKISKLIPLDSNMNLKKAFSIKKELIDLYHHNNDIKKLINISKKLEGVIKNIGKHAGGVVISPTKISDFIPIICDHLGNNQVTQFDKNDVEFVGLVKFDFLGLKTLTMIDMIIKRINKKDKIKKKFFLNKISLKNKKSFLLLKKSETTSVFQLESIGMRNLIKRLKPDSFEDIVSLVALYRPGPLQSGMVDNFINRKHGKEKISYPDSKWQHKWLKPILKSTYGIILYQEQVMQIAQILSNFTPSEADILRRAMAKKNPKEMMRQKKLFQSGAKENLIDVNLSKKIFYLLEKFSSYGFNKSHSVTYALLAYQTLWLKANYPSEFMVSAMTLDMTNTNKIVNLIYDARRMKLKIIPPNVNISNYSFSINKYGDIIYGLGAIKGLGKSSIDIIIEERKKKNNAFFSFLDFCVCLLLKKITRHVFEILIMSGACDCFNICRVELFNKIEYLLKLAKQKISNIQLQQNNLFNFNNDFFQKISIKNYKKEKNFYNFELYNIFLKKLQWEKEILGLYLSNHPIKNFLNEINYYTKGMKLNDYLLDNKKKNVILSGMIFSIKTMFTKKKKKFYIITLDDSYSRLDVLYFNNMNIQKDSIFYKKNIIVVIYGILSFDFFTNRSRIIIKKIQNIEQFRLKKIKCIKIYIKNNSKNDIKLFDLLYDFLINKTNKGKISVFFFLPADYFIKHKLFYYSYKIFPDNDFLNYLKFFKKQIIIKLNFFK